MIEATIRNEGKSELKFAETHHWARQWAEGGGDQSWCSA
jgi:hypothetical protein